MAVTGRQLAAFAILSFFCLFFFSSGLTYPDDIWQRLTATARTPDFSHYAPSRTLSDVDFPIHDPDKRVIILGDVHGMEKPLHAILAKLSYDPSSDVLLHVGDIIAKGPHNGSLAVVAYMAVHNITGVRGNHDQKVIEWRGWLEWMTRLEGGPRWLRALHAEYDAARPDDPEAWAEKHVRKAGGKWARRIPKGWKLLGDHYRVARDLSPEAYAYLLSLPLVLHVPAAHIFVAHGGVLPSDPRYKPYHRRQPLARVPALPRGISHDRAHPEKTLPLLRRLQEAAVLSDVPQNGDPWVTLNMRGVLPDHSVTRTKDGDPWADVWNNDVSLCGGFDQRMARAARGKPSLPCYPATVVYGHAASRGLDVKRWSVGLDSGCVYERRLSALVLDSKSQLTPFEDDGELEARKKKNKIRFGERGSANIVSVSCK